MSLIFISYRRDDSAGYAGRLHESLERRLGDGQIFRDVDALEPGQDFVDAIAARLRACGACLVLIGREWLEATDGSRGRRLDRENDYVRLEVAAALARPDVLVVPVLVEGMSMPAAEELPESIRALARRHAVSLRDDTWDADVDRLVGAVRKAAGLRLNVHTGDATGQRWGALDRRARHVLKWAAAAVLVLSVLLFAGRYRNNGRENTEREAATDVSPPEPPSERANPPSVVVSASAIEVPRLAESAHQHLIYTLLSGAIAPQGGSNTLSLRFRFSNEGSTAANFWDSSFRLAIPGREVAPTSGLNEVVPGYAVQQGVIRFELPAEATNGTLKIRDRGATGEMALSLRPTEAPSAVDRVDTRDALSHARIVRVAHESRPLVAGRNISCTLVSMTARRFVNALRIQAGLRVTNHGPSWYFGSDVARLLVDGIATAPLDGPSDVVASDTTASGTFLFDVPPSTRRVTLRITAESTVEASFDVPSTD